MGLLLHVEWIELSGQKKILDIMPVIASPGLSEAVEDRKKLAKEIEEKTGGMFKLEMTNIEKGTASIEGAYDEELNAPAILKKVKEAEEKGYSAVVIDCFGDPALDAARELVGIPVIGANEAACHLAAQMAPRFSIISILPEIDHLVRGLLAKRGLLQYLASMPTIGIPVLDLEKDREKTALATARAIEKAFKEDGAYAVVFSCTGMSSLVEMVQKQLDKKGVKVPIIEPLRAAVYSAIMFLLMGTSHSKAAYMPPRAKPTRL